MSSYYIPPKGSGRRELLMGDTWYVHIYWVRR